MPLAREESPNSAGQGARRKSGACEAKAAQDGKCHRNYTASCLHSAIINRSIGVVKYRYGVRVKRRGKSPPAGFRKECPHSGTR